MTIIFGFGELKNKNFWRAVMAEFLGCVLFLLIVTSVALPWENEQKSVSSNNVEIGIGVGLGITVLAYSFGHVSGGHFNPAVSLGMVVGGRISIIKGILYVIAQLVGAIAGSAITWSCISSNARRGFGVNKLGPGVSGAQGFGLELIFTFILVFYVFSATDPLKNADPNNATLGIGISILVSHVCLIPFTGCSINPARTFGAAVVANYWTDHWVYWVGPLVGGVIAALLYTFVFYHEEDEKKMDDLSMGKYADKRDTVMINERSA